MIIVVKLPMLHQGITLENLFLFCQSRTLPYVKINTTRRTFFHFFGLLSLVHIQGHVGAEVRPRIYRADGVEICGRPGVVLTNWQTHSDNYKQIRSLPEKPSENVYRKASSLVQIQEYLYQSSYSVQKSLKPVLYTVVEVLYFSTNLKYFYFT